ncbi:MAG: sodium-dependent transporter [Ruminococcaceae bacterium]|nr:sodium-dependent transporter [Oscillospiraceae bacterium]
MSEKRSSFTGKLGFVLAAAGSAVGLGNIWRFPYLAAQYGGGIFLLVYIILTLTFGFSLMAAEIAIGRKTGQSPIGAFTALGKKYAIVGYIGAAIPALILPYYSVIGGWVLKYMVGFVTGEGKAMATDGYFGAYISGPSEPVAWFIVFITITAFIVILGVNKGIEKVSKVMMPVLIALTIFIAVYTICTMDGAIEGVKYYILPDFKKFSFKTVVAAMGQLFYSLSIAMGIMITFGSYMKKDISIEKSIHQIEIFDTGVAFLAGLMIIPAVYAFSGLDGMNSGPGLMFITLPKIFETMPGGNIIGVVFFVMVFFAALTSSISLMETVVAVFQDRFKMDRIKATLLVLVISVSLGLISVFGYSIWSDFTLFKMQMLDFFDFLTNSLMMPICALLTCIVVGYCIKPKALIEELEIGGRFRSKLLFKVMICGIAPVCILLILLSSFGVIKI